MVVPKIVQLIVINKMCVNLRKISLSVKSGLLSPWIPEIIISIIINMPRIGDSLSPGIPIFDPGVELRRKMTGIPGLRPVYGAEYDLCMTGRTLIN
jgi:hypothetical protein